MPTGALQKKTSQEEKKGRDMVLSCLEVLFSSTVDLFSSTVDKVDADAVSIVFCTPKNGEPHAI